VLSPGRRSNKKKKGKGGGGKKGRKDSGGVTFGSGKGDDQKGGKRENLAYFCAHLYPGGEGTGEREKLCHGQGEWGRGKRKSFQFTFLLIYVLYEGEGGKRKGTPYNPLPGYNVE